MEYQGLTVSHSQRGLACWGGRCLSPVHFLLEGLQTSHCNHSHLREQRLCQASLGHPLASQESSLQIGEYWLALDALLDAADHAHTGHKHMRPASTLTEAEAGLTSAIRKSTFFLVKTFSCSRKSFLIRASSLWSLYTEDWQTPPATRASPLPATSLARSQAATFASSH